MLLFYIILFSLFGSIFSTIAGIILLWREKLAQKAALFLITFAAGVLLGVAFLDLIPEAFEILENIKVVAFWILSAIVLLFVIERYLWWYHHHRFDTEDHSHQHTQPAHAYLLLAGDSIHNFIDGVLIASAFLLSFPVGVTVTIGIIAHELPQEVADFSVMIAAGFSRAKTLILNLASALATLVGAVLAYFYLSGAEGLIPYLLAIGAGVFIYIALSDLIPSIHHQSEHKYDILQFLLFVGGIVLVSSL